MKISGTFEVKLDPLDFYTRGEQGIKFSRKSLRKRFYGELNATSKGEMLSAIAPVKGSAGYVAIEQVVGTLAGRRGSFVLQHYGIRERGSELVILDVLPDSGTDALSGICGTMTLESRDGGHFYELDYEIKPPAPEIVDTLSADSQPPLSQSG